MRLSNIRLSKVQRRRKLYLSKRLKEKGLSSYFSASSSVMTPESVYDSYDELVCTNCVETDYYLSQFCNELFCSPSSAIRHLEALIQNPEFPKTDLQISDIEYSQSCDIVSVPVTTYTCIDCNPLDERVPPRQVNRAPLHTPLECTKTNNYEKQRREMERDLIKEIYELVRDQQPHVSSAAAAASSSQSSRITKLHVSEMAIQRMENIQKINYSSQIERIKYKLLQSYRAFGRLDQFVKGMVGQSPVHGSVPYEQRIRDLERCLHIRP